MDPQSLPPKGDKRGVSKDKRYDIEKGQIPRSVRMSELKSLLILHLTPIKRLVLP